MLPKRTLMGPGPSDASPDVLEAIYFRSQKWLSAPPGLLPVSFADRAIQLVC